MMTCTLRTSLVSSLLDREQTPMMRRRRMALALLTAWWKDPLPTGVVDLGTLAVIVDPHENGCSFLD
jgi:hypothetical protein